MSAGDQAAAVEGVLGGMNQCLRCREWHKHFLSSVLCKVCWQWFNEEYYGYKAEQSTSYFDLSPDEF